MLEAFISEEALSLHKEYLKKLKLMYSVYEKSCSGAKGGGLKRGARKYLRHEAEKMKDIKYEIMLHETFFSSFSCEFQRCQAIKIHFGSESAFLYELLRGCCEISDGFLVVYKERDRVLWCSSSEYKRFHFLKKPILAIDLCEHSYFLDYGFDRERYLSNALKYLNIGLLEEK